jgi:hypothetical protein
VTAGNGITVSSGVVSLDYYTGSAVNYGSYPIGSYVMCNANAGFAPNNGLNQSAPYVWSQNSVGVQALQMSISSGNPGNGYAAVSGTWRNRGQTSDSGGGWIFQRVA